MAVDSVARNHVIDIGDRVQLGQSQRKIHILRRLEDVSKPVDFGESLAPKKHRRRGEANLGQYPRLDFIRESRVPQLPEDTTRLVDYVGGATYENSVEVLCEEGGLQLEKSSRQRNIVRIHARDEVRTPFHNAGSKRSDNTDARVLKNCDPRISSSKDCGNSAACIFGGIIHDVQS